MDAVIDLCDDEPPQQQQDDDECVVILDGAGNEAEAARPPRQQTAAADTDADQTSFLLDCGCHYSRAHLLGRLQKQAGSVQQQLQGAQTLDSLEVVAACFQCVQCGALLSSQDLPQLLGPGTTSRVYTALASGVRQVCSAVQQQGQAGDEATAAVAAVCVELWGELTALQALMLGGEPPSATAAATTPTRRQAQRGKGAQQQQQQAKPAKAKAKSSSKKPSSSSKAAWAAGTGYGGQGGMDKSAKAAMSAAARRQAAADTAMQAHLQAITAMLQDPLPAQQPGHSGRKRGRGEAALLGALPWPLVAVVLAGPLAWLLRLLFENDSLMDVVGRGELYSAGMELLRWVKGTRQGGRAEGRTCNKADSSWPC